MDLEAEDTPSDVESSEPPRKRLSTPNKKTMDDLKEEVNRFMTEQSKLHACADLFLIHLAEIRDSEALGSWNRYRLPDFKLFEGNNAKRLESITTELRNNVNRLLPDYLGKDTNVLEKMNNELRARWSYLMQKGVIGNDPERKLTPDDQSEGFQKSLMNTLMKQLVDDRFDTELADPAFKEACHQLRETIENQTASACFVCGGSILVGDSTRHDSSSSKGSMMSPPVDIFWATGNDSTARKLVLPLTHSTPESSNEVLRQLVADCNPASFGRGQQDIIDPEYRKAGKLDPHQFATSFHPANFGIIENVTDILLPSISSKTQNRLPFRKLSAELHKLNVYSGPSGLFRKHVDTPRSENQIGSMVVCLPSPFKGGSLIVQHQGKEVCFDWSAQSNSAIQWAAFYSDCEHEIKTITEGERITLTYNLYVTEPVGGLIPPSIIVEPQTLPLYVFLKELLTKSDFMKQGGVLGMYCSHAYPHTSDLVRQLLPRALKGSDLVLYSVFRSLGIEVDIRPVLSHEGDESDYVWSLEEYLKTGEDLELFYAEAPMLNYVDFANIDHRWKLLLRSRRVKGLGQLKENSDYAAGGPRVGTDLHTYMVTDRGQEEDMDDVIDDTWPSNSLPGITWINQPGHQEMAFSYVAYGNEASIETMYSYAAILAIIPPFDERQRSMSS